MSYGPFAKLVPYSSVVGGSVTVHSEPNGPVIAQLALLNVRPAPGEDHKAATQRIGQLLVDIINKYGSGL